MSKRHVAEPQPFEVRGSAIQGRGGFAVRPIAKGECIVEYTGERISWKEADRRYDDATMGRHHTFLFNVSSRTVIDAAVGGNDSRFINHSCDPNCEAVDERGRIFIYALRDIAEAEELAYDYAYERDESHSDEDEALYVCRCGSPKCRGTILAPAERKPASTHHAPVRNPKVDRRTKREEAGKSASHGRKKRRPPDRARGGGPLREPGQTRSRAR